MFNKFFNDISLQDIVLLKENAVPEGKLIDYKEQLHLDTKDQRKEFAADVTSFANTIGGYLVFGVSEDQGIINEIKGDSYGDNDKLKLQIENLLRDMVEPRITSLQIKFIEISPEKSVLIIHIPKSYSGPHIVRGREFFGRNTAGKYQLEYTEIKRRFIENEGLYNDIQNFHIDRVFKIKGNEGYMHLAPGGSIVLHVLPLSAFGFNAPILDLGSPEKGQYWPLTRTGANYHIGFEGIGWHMDLNQKCYGYHHINRKGIVEIVDRYLLQRNPENTIKISIPTIEKSLMEVSSNIEQNYLRFGIDGPFVLRFALLDVGQAQFYNQNGFVTQYNILQSDLIFPEKIINDFSEFGNFTSQVTKLLYNAAGWSE